ncbi:MAG: hypothetical protein ACYSUT_03245 [Planctomycetota bacterium]|jgi:hypothetical protein
MGIYESNMKIKDANKDMGIFWEKTKGLWKDAKAEQFEHEFIERLAVEVKRAGNILNNTGVMLDRIRADLQDRP